MSAKWIRSKQWDDEHIPSWAWPVRFILRALSSITLAVILLASVAVFAILASVPVGLLVLGLTYLFYGATLLAAVAVGTLIPLWTMRRVWRPTSSGARAARFVVTFVAGLALAAVAAQLWYSFACPRLMYEPAHGTGVRFFGTFVDTYRSTTLRRLPGFEMSELEFYSWWPLRLVLLLFVTNMVVATVRRIEFTFPNLGVLTVHTGIVTIALGSVYYKGLKQEGDTLLLAGEPGADGAPTPGIAQTGFYDNTAVALWTRLSDGPWEQRLIQPPRYNDYNLDAHTGVSAEDVLGATTAAGRTLDESVPRPAGSQLDPSLTFRIVGYASYADPVPTWIKADPAPGTTAQPMRFAKLMVQRGEKPVAWPFFFLPDLPAQRLGETEVFGIEYIRGIDAQRVADLTTPIPDGARHALIVDVPASGARAAFHSVYKIAPGEKITVGDTGYALEVQDIQPQPPFPIITEGYRGATSSVAIVRITPPAAPPPGPEAVNAQPPAPKAFTRYVYHRFPAIDQDMLDELNERGMPERRDADPSIRLTYIDASKLQVYLDEPRAVGASPSPPVRAIVRMPGDAARIIDAGPDGIVRGVMPGLDIALGERWDHAVQSERPQVIPDRERRKDEIGTHGHAMLAVEVAATPTGTAPWKRIVWLPFTRYLMVDRKTERLIDLPDGRHLTLVFGRIRHSLPGFMVQLMDFKMIAYDHRGSPRDYQSVLRVVPIHDGAGPAPFETFTHLASLNAPLQAPFHWSDDRSYLANVAGTFLSRLSPRQFKFSQAGWDQQGWAQTQKLADAGQLPRPYASFTILGVGNNPGIHVVALGAILMSIGIPWAFYIKPFIMKRRRDRLKAQLAREGRPTGEAVEAVPAGALAEQEIGVSNQEVRA